MSDKKQEERKENGMSRRDMIKTAGIMGAGMAALSGMEPSQVMAIPSSPPPKGPVMTEFLYDQDTGEIMAACVNNDPSSPRLSTGPSRKNAWIFQTFDHGKMDQATKKTGIIMGGPKGKYLAGNAGLVLNPNAERTLVKTGLI